MSFNDNFRWLNIQRPRTISDFQFFGYLYKKTALRVYVEYAKMQWQAIPVGYTDKK